MQNLIPKKEFKPIKPWVLALMALPWLLVMVWLLFQNEPEKLPEKKPTIVATMPVQIITPAGTNILNLNQANKQVVLEIAKPIELDFKMKNEIFEIRKKSVALYSELLGKPYEPSQVIYGQIGDQKPWWGMFGIFHYGNGQKSIEGPSEESRMLLNPYVLIYPHETFAFRGEPPVPAPEMLSAKWILGEVPSLVVEMNLFPFVSMLRVTRGAPESVISLTLDTLNARDFGFNYFAIDTQQSDDIRPSMETAEIRTMKHFIHVGGSCGYPGGCNNSSPNDRQSEFLVKKLPASLRVVLWKNQPIQKSDTPDVEVNFKFK